MGAHADHHDDGLPALEAARNSSQGSDGSPERIVGRFFARLWDIDCVLELCLNNAGCIEGLLIADDEPLEIAGGSPDPNGDVRGLIRARSLTEAFAVFQAHLAEDGLFLQVNLADAETGLEIAADVMFVRLG